MTKLKLTKRQPKVQQELDSVYFLKLIMYLIIGAHWLRLTSSSGQNVASLPVGLFIGMGFAMHDHFRIDRKIEFAVLLIATLVGFYAAIGISLSV